MIDKTYFDKDYFETSGIKSGYNLSNFNRNSYLYEAMAIWLNEFLPFADARILEIGCAYGWLVEQLVLLYNYDAYGQDISTWSVNHKPQQIQDRIFECNDIEICLDRQFDIILSFETFEHIPENRVSEYVQNMYDCLNEKGILFGTICLGWNNDRGEDPDESHQTLQPRAWWDDKFQQAGFIPRKDIEADAYEIGIQTSRMDEGQWLPRYYNWHVFAAQKKGKSEILKSEDFKVYDRTLLTIQSNELRPKLLVAGNREGNFTFPTTDFFQVDSWGNYLSYFFDGEYKSLANGGYELIDWNQYDLLIVALDHDTVSELYKSNWSECNKKIGILAGTLSMIIERNDHRQRLLELLNNFDIILAHAPHVKKLLEIFNIKSTLCSEIFPFRFFDLHFNHIPHDGFNILCAGVFDSHCSLSSLSLFLASKFADKVLMAIDPESSINAFSIPKNAELFHTISQNEFYSKIISRTDMVLKMDNPAGVGRIIAEAAAAQIPSISSPDLFQIRCFPELIVPSLDSLEDIEEKIRAIKNDKEWADQVGMLARSRLKASNKEQFTTMVKKLNEIGFDIEEPEGLYW